MAITSDQFQLNLDGAFEKILEESRSVMEVAALAAKAMLAKRILAEGFGRKYKSKPYINYRLRLGRPVDFVNLSLTGKMFQGWNVPESEIRGTTVTAGVKGGDIETNIKLQANKSRYPTFDHLNEYEIELILTLYIKPKLIEILRKSLLS